MLGWVQVFAVFLLKKDEGGAISVCCCFAEKGWGRCHLFGKHLGNNQTPTLIGSTCLVWPQCWELVRDGTFTQHCLFASSWVVSNLFAIIFDWAEDYGKPMVDFSWWLWGKDLRRVAPIFTNTFDQNKGGKTADSRAALGLGQVVWRGGEGLRETRLWVDHFIWISRLACMPPHSNNLWRWDLTEMWWMHSLMHWQISSYCGLVFSSIN